MEQWNNGTEDPELAIASEGDELDETRVTGHPPSSHGYGEQRKTCASG